MKKTFTIFIIFFISSFSYSQSNQNLLPVKINYKWGFINRSGNIIIEPIFDYTENFVCNLAKVNTNGKYGVIDNSGKVIVPLEYTDISILCPNYIAIKKDSLWGLDDQNGTNIVANNYQKITYIENKTFLLKKNNLFGLYNSELSKSIEPTYSSITNTQKGFFEIIKSGKKGLIDSTLEYTVQPEYNDVVIVNNTTFLLKQKDFWGIYDNNGTVTVKSEYMAFKIYSNNLIGLKTKKSTWVLFAIDSKKIISNDEQESYSIIDHDLIMSNKAHKHGVISKNGTIVLPQIYSNIHLNDGLLLVEMNGKWGLADKAGKFIIETIHNKLFPFKKNMAVFETETGKGVIDNKGKIIIKPIYTNIDIESVGAKCYKSDGSVSVIKFQIQPAPKATNKTTKPQIVALEPTSSGHAWLKGPNKKWGLLGHDTLLIPYKFDDIIEIDLNTFIIVQKIDYRTNQKVYGYINANKIIDLASGKVGLANKTTGKILVQPNFWYIRSEDFSTGNFAKIINEGGQQGIVNLNGKVISEITVTKDKKTFTKIKLDYVGNFNGGIAKFCSGCNVNLNGNWEIGNKIDGGKWGYINQSGTVVQEPMYEYASDFVNNRAIVSIKGLYGMINTTGNFILKPEYQKLTFIQESQSMFVKSEYTKEKFGIIDTKGQALSNINYDKIFVFKNELAKVFVNGKYGYIDKNDKIVIQPIYDQAMDFSENLAAVCTNKKWGYINKLGAVTILPTYQMAGDFKNNLAAITKDGKIGYINSGEKIIIPIQYTKGSVFENNVAIVTLPDGKTGVINPEGTYLIEPKYDEIKFFSNTRYLKVKSKDQYQVYDITKKVMFKKSFSDIGEFTEGMAWVRNDANYTYIDSTGNVAIKKKFSGASNFSDALAKVQLNGKYGYINRKGETVIDFLYANCTDFNQDKAFIEGPNKFFSIIDRNGKNITFDKFINPKPFSNSFALVNAPNKDYYFVDGAGNNAFDNFQYEQAYSFENDVARVKSKKWGLVNASGYQNLKFKYDYMSEFTNGQAIVALYGSIGILDLDGNIVAEPTFDSFAYMGDGIFRLEKWDAIGYYSKNKNWLWELKK